MTEEEDQIVDRIAWSLQRHLGDVWTSDARRAAQHIYEDVVAPAKRASVEAVPVENGPLGSRTR